MHHRGSQSKALAKRLKHHGPLGAFLLGVVLGASPAPGQAEAREPGPCSFLPKQLRDTVEGGKAVNSPTLASYCEEKRTSLVADGVAWGAIGKPPETPLFMVWAVNADGFGFALSRWQTSTLAAVIAPDDVRLDLWAKEVLLRLDGSTQDLKVASAEAGTLLLHCCPR